MAAWRWWPSTSSQANPQHIAAARVGGDGRIHALAHGTGSGGAPALLLLRLSATTLLLDSATAYSRSSSFRLFRGRAISGTAMVAAAGTTQPEGGLQPLLVIGRDSGAQEVTLPMPEALGGLPTNINASTAALPTATAVAGGRAIFAANLEADNGAAIGFVAVIRPEADQSEHEVDSLFGNRGAAAFRYTGNGGCWARQSLGNISSWGNATAVVAATSPSCDAGVAHPLIARIDTQPNPLLGDSFE